MRSIHPSRTSIKTSHYGHPPTSMARMGATHYPSSSTASAAAILRAKTTGHVKVSCAAHPLMPSVANVASSTPEVDEKGQEETAASPTSVLPSPANGPIPLPPPSSEGPPEGPSDALNGNSGGMLISAGVPSSAEWTDRGQGLPGSGKGHPVIPRSSVHTCKTITLSPQVHRGQSNVCCAL